MLFPTTLVGSYPQPEWLIDRKKLAGRFPPRVRAKELWRIPDALLAEAQEDATLLAIRAQEEAGLAVDGELLPVHRFLTSPGGSTESVAVFCGRVDSRAAGGIHGLAAEHEDIKVVVKTYAEAMALQRAGKIENVFSMVALYWLAANRAKLRKRWR